MALVQVQELAKAPGEVVPSGKIQIVQHFEGGIVTKVLVDDGQRVVRGQDLVILSPAQALAELKRLKNRENALQMDVMRLQAFLENEPLTVEQLTRAVTDYENEDVDEILKLARSNISLLNQRRRQMLANREEVSNTIIELERELEVLNAQIQNFREQEVIISTEIGIYNELEKTSSVSVISKLNAEERLRETHDDMLLVVRNKNTTESQLVQAKENLVNLDNEFFTQANEELNDITAQLGETQDTISTALDRVDRLNIISPANGVVKGLEVTPGSVIDPGGIVCEVVPVDERMIVEARITTEDIGHISVGQPVRVKVSTYNFAVYGAAEGVVQSLSPSTFFDENGLPYYKAKIELSQNYVGSDPDKNLILPGMVVTADIKTGSKSLLVYLLKPIHRALDTSFSER